MTQKKAKWTDAELKRIAEDLYKGDIFTDRHCKTPEDCMMSFFPLMFMDKKGVTELNKTAGLIFQYRNCAMPRGINGMPMFLSFHVLPKKETKTMFEYYHKIKDAVKKVK